MLNVVFAFVLQNPDATRVSDTLQPIHFEPQVAFLCNEGQSFHPQYMSDQGRWTTDPESKVSCLKDKVDVLTYCKKVSEPATTGR